MMLLKKKFVENISVMSCLNIINIFTLTFTDSTLLNFYSSKQRDFLFLFQINKLKINFKTV